MSCRSVLGRSPVSLQTFTVSAFTFNTDQLLQTVSSHSGASGGSVTNVTLRAALEVRTREKNLIVSDHLCADNVELVLQPSAIPESGTASVRARPTVKHISVSVSVSTVLLIPRDIYIALLIFAYLNNAGFAWSRPSVELRLTLFSLVVIFILNSGARM